MLPHRPGGGRLYRQPADPDAVRHGLQHQHHAGAGQRHRPLVRRGVSPRHARRASRGAASISTRPFPTTISPGSATTTSVRCYAFRHDAPPGRDLSQGQRAAVSAQPALAARLLEPAVSRPARRSAPTRSRARNGTAAPISSPGSAIAATVTRREISSAPRERGRDLDGGEAEGWVGPALNAASPAPVPWDAAHLFAYLRHGWDAEHGAAAGPMQPVVDDLGAGRREPMCARSPPISRRGRARSSERQRRERGGQGAGAGAERAGCRSPGRARSRPPRSSPAPAPAAMSAAAETAPPRGVDLALSTAINDGDPRNAIMILLDGIAPDGGRAGPLMPGFAGALHRRTARRRCCAICGRITAPARPGPTSKAELRKITGQQRAAMITLSVNGTAHRLEIDPATPLLYALRGELGLNGAKFGCGLGQCGACTVIVEGEPVFACLLPVAALQDRAGHDDRGARHRRQAEPAAAGLYRRAGGAMRLLHRRHGDAGAGAARPQRRRRPMPQIRAWMEPNLCRCGTHMRILKAIRRASDALKAAAPPAEEANR